MRETLESADPFPAGTEAQWRLLVERVLKGAPYDSLVSSTADGLAIQPLYKSVGDAGLRALRADGKRWQIAARIEHQDADQAATQIRDDLGQGATALHLVFTGSHGAQGFGLPGDRNTVGTCLDRVDLNKSPAIELDLGRNTGDVPVAVAKWLAARHLGPAQININFGIDPVGSFLMSGGDLADWPHISQQAKDLCKTLFADGYQRHLCVADSRVVHAAGGTEVQELAFAMTSAIACLRMLESAGLDIDAACGAVGFRFAADADELLTVAKLRAVRRLWARIVAVCGARQQPVHLHAETAWRMMSRRDPWVNMLRTTMACFGAAIGSADVITVQGFTQALGLPDPFARRIARNTQIVLLEESGLARVADPAGGAGAFEAMTDSLCEAAWNLLQQVEQEGGLLQSLAAGRFQARVQIAAERRAKAIAQRSIPITGTRTFPALRDTPVSILARIPERPPTGDATANPVMSMISRRDAQEFEALRDRADQIAVAKGQIPRIFLANLGSLAEAMPRSLFARSFFESGGIETIGPDGNTSMEDLKKAFSGGGTPIACLCSSDAGYEKLAAQAAKVLISSGAKYVYLAGRPGNAEDAWLAAGITDFVFSGCDAVAVLGLALARLSD